MFRDFYIVALLLLSTIENNGKYNYFIFELYLFLLAKCFFKSLYFPFVKGWFSRKRLGRDFLTHSLLSLCEKIKNIFCKIFYCSMFRQFKMIWNQKIKLNLNIKAVNFQKMMSESVKFNYFVSYFSHGLGK